MTGTIQLLLVNADGPGNSVLFFGRAKHLKSIEFHPAQEKVISL